MEAAAVAYPHRRGGHAAGCPWANRAVRQSGARGHDHLASGPGTLRGHAAGAAHVGDAARGRGEFLVGVDFAGLAQRVHVLGIVHGNSEVRAPREGLRSRVNMQVAHENGRLLLSAVVHQVCAVHSGRARRELRVLRVGHDGRRLPGAAGYVRVLLLLLLHTRVARRHEPGVRACSGRVDRGSKADSGQRDGGRRSRRPREPRGRHVFGFHRRGLPVVRVHGRRGARAPFGCGHGGREEADGVGPTVGVDSCGAHHAGALAMGRELRARHGVRLVLLFEDGGGTCSGGKGKGAAARNFLGPQGHGWGPSAELDGAVAVGDVRCAPRDGGALRDAHARLCRSGLHNVRCEQGGGPGRDRVVRVPGCAGHDEAAVGVHELRGPRCLGSRKQRRGAGR